MSRPEPDAQVESDDASGRATDVLAEATDAYGAVGPSGIIVAWNHQAERILGWNRSDAIGRDFHDTVVAPSSRSNPRLSVPGLLAAAHGPVSSRCIEFDVVHRLGRCFPAEMTFWTTPVKGCPALHFLLRDISYRRHTEEVLVRTSRLVYSLDEAVLAVSADGTIRSWNRGAERTFGYSGFEIVGRDVSFLVDPSDAPQLVQWWLDLRPGARTQRHEISAIRKNGVVITVDVTVSPLEDRVGSIDGASIIARDVTAQRWMATTLEGTLRSLETALKETRQSEERCRRFLADAAHQLRTPIAGIRACAETLLRGAPHSEREQLLMMVVRETARASRVMSGLLAMARVDGGQHVTVKICDAVALCREEVDRWRSLAPGLDIQVYVEGPIDPWSELDANVVREILTNLLDNASRHAASRIGVLVARGDGLVEIRVVDDGPGIAHDLVGRAFERFVSLDGGGGSGLGLPIAKGLAQSHGGDLTYDGGFVLQLPSSGMRVDCGGAARPGPLPAG
ncbi:MAG: PAS domain S-box protein [Actinomycetota bacterium]|nr:PAS domain S-box protein [Actinomycetota bacterium]